MTMDNKEEIKATILQALDDWWDGKARREVGEVEREKCPQCGNEWLHFWGCGTRRRWCAKCRIDFCLMKD